MAMEQQNHEPIRNEDKTKQEALKAKKKLKDNSLPPALSTRSNDRVLRSKDNNINIGT